jgi:hypothetical protein
MPFCPHYGINYEKTLYETFPVNYDEEFWVESYLVST